STTAIPSPIVRPPVSARGRSRFQDRDRIACGTSRGQGPPHQRSVCRVVLRDGTSLTNGAR
ncbi:hypothetical protein FOZ62_021311, partial [Perkinsus olseni]